MKYHSNDIVSKIIEDENNTFTYDDFLLTILKYPNFMFLSLVLIDFEYYYMLIYISKDVIFLQ